jgi:hypothetical protein
MFAMHRDEGDSRGGGGRGGACGGGGGGGGGTILANDPGKHTRTHTHSPCTQKQNIQSGYSLTPIIAPLLILNVLKCM